MRHAREDHLRRRLRKPDRRLRSLALLVGKSGTARRRSYDDGGFSEARKLRKPDYPERPPAAPGLGVRSRALDSASPMRLGAAA
jgi:hypothetical protein